MSGLYFTYERGSVTNIYLRPIVLLLNRLDLSSLRIESMLTHLAPPGMQLDLHEIRRQALAPQPQNQQNQKQRHHTVRGGGDVAGTSTHPGGAFSEVPGSVDAGERNDCGQGHSLPASQ